jgi:hypothetical protein
MVHPNLIHQKVGFIIPESAEPFVERVSPLFLQANEIIHSKLDTLQLKALIHVMEVHDFSASGDSDNDR